LLERGNVYFNKGQLNQAIADYDEVLRINPNYAQAARKRDEAIKKQQEAIRKQQEAAEQKRRQQEAEARARQEAIRKQQEAAEQKQKRRQQEAEARARQVVQALATMRNHNLPPTVRAEAGRKLAKLGDPRPEVMTVKGMQFCLVPAGTFWMGNKVQTKPKPKPKSGWFSFLTGNKQDDQDDQEKQDPNNPPLHQVKIPYSFWISRYPVTNAQFLEYLKGGGYGYEPDWYEAKIHGYWKNGRVKGYLDRQWRDRPHDFGAPYNLPNHPVVGVMWYEALAFTRWLTRRWSGSSPARLLTEAEWEKAARGGIEIPATALICPATNLAVPAGFAMRPNPLPKRHYPWGNEFDSTYANSEESGIGKINAVGCFVKGQSPYGCEEMSGNVWEWLQSQYKEYPYRPNNRRENLAVDATRVLRGGSHYTTTTSVRCFHRRWDLPDLGYLSWGFRVFRRNKLRPMATMISDL
ncbi:MAG: SUMF1/EgtB/PvdO family nonheme iron enzyme, partial [Ardenticatenaceae bacterium]